MGGIHTALVGLTGFGIFFIIELFHDLDVWLHACTAALSCPLTFIYAAQKIPISKFEEDEELCYAG